MKAIILALVEVLAFALMGVVGLLVFGLTVAIGLEWLLEVCG